LFTQAEQGALPGAVAFRATTKELNPAVSDAFLESERLMLGEGPFRREYMAEFTAGAAGAFLEEDAVKAVVGRYHELSPSQGTGWLIAFDPSFSVDPSAAIVIGRALDDNKRLVVAHSERWVHKASRSERRRAKTEAQRLDVASSVLDAVAKLSIRFNNCPIVTDQHSRRLVESGLRERGVNVVRHRAWTSSTQTEAFRMLRARIYADTISLPIDDQLIRELCRVRERTCGGKSEVDLPRSVDGHLDMAVSLALGAWEQDVRGGSQPMIASQAWKKRAREDQRRALVARVEPFLRWQR
jgi:hypothetical protein